MRELKRNNSVYTSIPNKYTIILIYVVFFFTLYAPHEISRNISSFLVSAVIKYDQEDIDNRKINIFSLLITFYFVS